jgi:hypothetical protein
MLIQLGDCDRVSTEKYDEEFRDRAVRMYRDRLAEPGETSWEPAGTWVLCWV